MGSSMLDALNGRGQGGRQNERWQRSARLRRLLPKGVPFADLHESLEAA